MNNNILAVTALALGLSTTPLNADAQTFVYISNAGDGTITGFQLGDDGNLEPAGTTEVAALVMPMAASPDGKVLYAATRSAPFTLFAWNVSAQDGSLDLLGTAPLGHNMLYVSTDRSGQYLLAASNSSNVITVTALDEEGRPASEPLFTQSTRHYTHAIRTNHLNTLAFAPTLGENAVEQFRFDVETGALSHNEPQLAAIREGAGPRHFVYSPDDRHLYVVNQFMGSVAGFVVDQDSGTLAPLGIFDALPGTSLNPGRERPPVSSNGPAKPDPNAIWAADIEITPDGRLLYVTERTTSQIIGFRRNGESGELTYLGATATENQPRDFAIDPLGQFLIVAGEKSGHATVYRIDAESGELTTVDRAATGTDSAWVEILTVGDG